ncbi:MAG TPA: MFS transporter [Micromonosporaceae bacterium]|nr:MFS transporter [Micromonosporaceae bacterium]
MNAPPPWEPPAFRRGGGAKSVLPVTGLLAAKAVSDVGFALDFICLSVFVWVRTGSVLVTGLVGLALYAGGVVGGRLGHRYGAGWDRRRAMVVADLARMVALLVLAVVPDGAQLAWLFPAVLVVGAGRAVFEATLAAATPALAGARLQLVNSAVSGLKGLALVAGMGLAAVAVPVLGFRGIFLLDAASYALSAVVVLTLPVRLREHGPAAPAGTARVQPGRRRAGHGWAVLVGAGIAGLLVVRGLDAFGSASHHVGLPVLGGTLNPANPAHVAGALWSAWAVGTLAGSFVLRPVLSGLVERLPALVFYLATTVMSAGFIGVFWLGAWPLMLVAAALAGVGDALSEITFKQAVQRLPDERRGSVFGLAQVVINAGFTAGLLVTSVAVAPSQVAGWVLLLHGIPLAAALGSTLWPGPARARVPAPTTVGGDR